VGAVAVLAVADLIAAGGPLCPSHLLTVGGIGLIIVSVHTGEALDIEIAVTLPVFLAGGIAPCGLCDLMALRRATNAAVIARGGRAVDLLAHKALPDVIAVRLVTISALQGIRRGKAVSDGMGRPAIGIEGLFDRAMASIT
jgi:hypothetical protein